ncbi:hypothetical protein BC831DRAFT_449025 [Entophlyctis helioformis]|nr:hypothetical protein BC831DRAFT_449025 [Entophlyctis helioformis]
MLTVRVQSHHAVALCSGDHIALFNRVRSQTVSTRYLTVSADGTRLTSRHTPWEAFIIWSEDDPAYIAQQRRVAAASAASAVAPASSQAATQSQGADAAAAAAPTPSVSQAAQQTPRSTAAFADDAGRRRFSTGSVYDDGDLRGIHSILGSDSFGVYGSFGHPSDAQDPVTDGDNGAGPSSLAGQFQGDLDGIGIPEALQRSGGPSIFGREQRSFQDAFGGDINTRDDDEGTPEPGKMSGNSSVSGGSGESTSSTASCTRTIHYGDSIVLENLLTGLMTVPLVVRRVEGKNMAAIESSHSPQAGGQGDHDSGASDVQAQASSSGHGAAADSCGSVSGQQQQQQSQQQQQQPTTKDAVSQLHKVAFQVKSQPGHYISLRDESIVIHKVKQRAVKTGTVAKGQQEEDGTPASMDDTENDESGQSRTRRRRAAQQPAPSTDACDGGSQSPATLTPDLRLEDVTDLSVWSIVGTDLVEHTFYMPPTTSDDDEHDGPLAGTQLQTHGDPIASLLDPAAALSNAADGSTPTSSLGRAGKRKALGRTPHFQDGSSPNLPSSASSFAGPSGYMSQPSRMAAHDPPPSKSRNPFLQMHPIPIVDAVVQEGVGMSSSISNPSTLAIQSWYPVNLHTNRHKSRNSKGITSNVLVFHGREFCANLWVFAGVLPAATMTLRSSDCFMVEFPCHVVVVTSDASTGPPLAQQRHHLQQQQQQDAHGQTGQESEDEVVPLLLVRDDATVFRTGHFVRLLAGSHVMQ